MVRDYELMYIIRPELDDETVQTTIDGVGALIESNGGELLKVTPWGKRRLAFEVNHLRDGYYVLTKLRLDGDRVTDIERSLRISDTVFRHLLVLDEGTPDDESGVPGRPSRKPRGEATVPPRAATAPVAEDDDEIEADDEGGEDEQPLVSEVVAVAAGEAGDTDEEDG